MALVMLVKCLLSVFPMHVPGKQTSGLLCTRGKSELWKVTHLSPGERKKANDNSDAVPASKASLETLIGASWTFSPSGAGAEHTAWPKNSLDTQPPQKFKLQTSIHKLQRARKELQEREGAGITRNNTEKQECFSSYENSKRTKARRPPPLPHNSFLPWRDSFVCAESPIQGSLFLSASCLLFYFHY